VRFESVAKKNGVLKLQFPKAGLFAKLLSLQVL